MDGSSRAVTADTYPEQGSQNAQKVSIVLKRESCARGASRDSAPIEMQALDSI